LFLWWNRREKLANAGLLDAIHLAKNGWAVSWKAM
jgi:hypothetical protein